MLEKMQKFLVEDWRLVWRYWSTRLGIIGTALTGWLIASPDAALYAWSILPEDLKGAIPPQYTPFIGVFIFAVSLVSKMIRQPKVENLRQCSEKEQIDP